MLNLRIASIVALATLSLAAPLSAQGDSAPPPAPTKLGVVPAQATRGEQVYKQVCVACHELLEYTGPDFRAKWNTRPIYDLVELMRSSMPDDAPGTLTPKQYVDVVIYMMKLNGVAAGKTEVPTDDAVLKKLKMDIPAMSPISLAKRHPAP